MLGSVVKATGIVRLDSLLMVVEERFPGRIGDLNKQLIETAYEEVIGG
jgi:Pyruvate/2-oxoacid:ferredoxin oxidoreductase gamma subunit